MQKNKTLFLLICFLLFPIQIKANPNSQPDYTEDKDCSCCQKIIERYERQRQEYFERDASKRIARDLFLTNSFSAEGGVIANFNNDGFYTANVHLLWFGLEYFKYIPAKRTYATSGDDHQYNLSGFGFDFAPFAMGSWLNKETVNHRLTVEDHDGYSLIPYASLRHVNWRTRESLTQNNATVTAAGLKFTLRNSAFRFSVRTEYIVSNIKIYSGFMAGMMIGFGN